MFVAVMSLRRLFAPPFLLAAACSTANADPCRTDLCHVLARVISDAPNDFKNVREDWVRGRTSPQLEVGESPTGPSGLVGQFVLRTPYQHRYEGREAFDRIAEELHLLLPSWQFEGRSAENRLDRGLTIRPRSSSLFNYRAILVSLFCGAPGREPDDCYISVQISNFRASELADFYKRQNDPPDVPGGEIAVAVTPGGAQVYLDDEPKGIASEEGRLVLRGLSAGNHLVRISLPGYRDFSRTVTITPGQTLQLRAELQRRGPEPLAEWEVEKGLQDGLPPRGMKKLVEQLGVGFAVNDEIEKRLRGAGADDSLILAIMKNKK